MTYQFFLGIILGVAIAGVGRGLRVMYNDYVGNLKKALMTREQTCYEQGKLIDQLKATNEAMKLNQQQLEQRLIKLKSENVSLGRALESELQRQNEAAGIKAPPLPGVDV